MSQLLNAILNKDASAIQEEVASTLSEKVSELIRYKKLNVSEDMFSESAVHTHEEEVAGFKHKLETSPQGRYHVTVRTKIGDHVAHTSSHPTYKAAKRAYAAQVNYSKRHISEDTVSETWNGDTLEVDKNGKLTKRGEEQMAEYTRKGNERKARGVQSPERSQKFSYVHPSQTNNESIKDVEQGLVEMDSQGYTGSRERGEHDAGKKEYFGKIVKPGNVDKHATSVLIKSLNRALSKEKKVIPSLDKNRKEQRSYINRLGEGTIQPNGTDTIPVTTSAPSIGDKVHMGHVTKGGSGVSGKLHKIDGKRAHVIADNGNEYRGYVSNLSKKD